MVRVAICEDDKYFQNKENELLKSYFEKNKIDHDIQIFESGNELLRNYRNEYNIIFLDISLEGMDGIEIARQLREKQASAYIVFLTAYVEYCLEAYKVDAHRYLLKNDENLQHKMYECMDSIMRKISNTAIKINLDVQGGILSIEPSMIMFAESKGHKVTIHVYGDGQESKEYSMYDRLSNLQSLLKNYGFIRIHQSYLINESYLKNVYRYTAELEDGTCLGISKKYYKETEDYFIHMKEI